jgi:hypothetical protein
MLSRALSLATVTLLIGCFAADPAHSQATNLEAGKSPSQIFAGTCTACHKGPRGLLKTVPPGSLSGFLRQHYTTSSEMASLLSSFLISNGASDTRNVPGAKQAKDAKPEAKPGSSPEQVDRQGHKLRPQEVAQPDADGLTPQGRKRLARPGEAPDATKPAAEGQPPVQAAGEHGPEGGKSAAKLKLGRRGKPGSEEPPKADTARTEPSTSAPVNEEKPKGEAAKEEGNKPGEAKPETAKSEAAKSETAKSETAKPETAKPETAKSESAKIDAPKAAGGGETPVLRADPVPPVTPAPPSPPAASVSASSSPSEPVAGPSAPAPPAAPAAPAAPSAVTASAPPPAPIVPAGPPAPPISQ